MTRPTVRRIAAAAVVVGAAVAVAFHLSTPSNAAQVVEAVLAVLAIFGM